MSADAGILVPALLGPTGVGKTDFAVRLAAKHGFEIVSCDSRQVYRHMDIGTAKPTRQEQALARHWMIDIIEPSEPYSAYQYAAQAREIIRKRNAGEISLLVCGGTGLYYKSLSEGLGLRVASNPHFRARLEKRAAHEGPDAVFEELRRVDPDSAERLHPHDLRRVIRALQVYHDTGIAMSKHLQHPDAPAGMTFVPLFLSLPRELLYARINRRVDAMMEKGLWEEFCVLRKRDFGPDAPGMECVGYKELFDVADGKATIEQAADLIKQHTRRYAKRQLTWFAHQAKGVAVDVSRADAFERIEAHIRKACGKD
jgi:tRNA dimethylallyltransferase